MVTLKANLLRLQGSLHFKWSSSQVSSPGAEDGSGSGFRRQESGPRP